MAFDGVTIAAVAAELKRELVGGRLAKSAQPESDELLLTIKQPDGTKRLFLSAEASLPLVYLTDANKPSPMTAPGFCMLLRKHLQNGRITSVSQPGLERILRIEVEHLDEMGDLKRKALIIEIMGKHSNIIFCDGEDRIIDSIKRVSAAVSSVREVLPVKPYFIPQTQEKHNILRIDQSSLQDVLSSKPQPLYKAIYGSYTGISPIVAQELCHRAHLDGERPTAALTEDDYRSLYAVVDALVQDIRGERFSPCIAYTGSRPVEFAALPLTLYEGGADHTESCPSISALLERFYAEKNALSRIRQKSADLRRIVQTALERNVKKYDLQLHQMKDTEKRETFRVYGELLNTYGYSAEPGASSLEALNYYTDEKVTIPLDPTLSARENAQRYFDRYGKLKRTFEALSKLTEEVKKEIDHLESIGASLDIAQQEEDLAQIKEEHRERLHPQKGRRQKGKDHQQALPLSQQRRFSYLCGKKQLSKRRPHLPVCLRQRLVVPRQKNTRLPRDRKGGKLGRTAGPHLRGGGPSGGLLLQGQRAGKGGDRLCTEKADQKAKRRQAGVCRLLHQLFHGHRQRHKRDSAARRLILIPV